MKAIRAVLDQRRALSLSEIQVRTNSEEESSLLNEDIKCFLMEEFGHYIKFIESDRENESQFVFPVAT